MAIHAYTRMRKLVQNGAMASRISAGFRRAGARDMASAMGYAIANASAVESSAMRSDETYDCA